MSDAMRDSARVPVRFLIFLAAAFLVTAGDTFTTSAQGPGLDGQTVWDGVFTKTQVERGLSTFLANCANCHGEDLRGTPARPSSLVGDSWMGNFQTQTAEDLFNFLSTRMPNATPGSLTSPEYLDLAALILSSNGMPAGETELTAESAVGVTIIPEDGELVPLQNATLIRVVGCLAEDDSGWVVNNATLPQRITNSGVGPNDADVALGDESFPLLFVLLPLDEVIGHRVSVSGLSEGIGAADGINVTTVDSVTETCQ